MPTNGRSALLVEDNDSARKLFRSILEREGWKVIEAENGIHALEAITAEVPDVILLDLMMPEMNGIELIDELRNHSTWKDIPIVVVTAKELTQAERQLLEESVTRVIQKGTRTPNELLGEVQHWFARARVSK